MIVIKTWYHFSTIVKKLFLYLIYGSKLKIGKNTTWRRGFSVMKATDAKIEIGDNCFFNNDCSINSNHLIKIGGGYSSVKMSRYTIIITGLMSTSQ